MSGGWWQRRMVTCVSLLDNIGLRDPLRALIDKVAKHAFRVTEQDIATARASGLRPL